MVRTSSTECVTSVGMEGASQTPRHWQTSGAIDPRRCGKFRSFCNEQWSNLYIRGVRTTSEYERSPKAFTQRVNNLCLVVNDSAMTKELTIFKCLRRIWNPGGRGCASHACRRNMLECPDECAARIAKILVCRRRLKLKEK